MMPTPVASFSHKHCPVPYEDANGYSAYDYAAGEQAVWRSVIMQALIDAASNSKKKENMQWKEEALIWLRGTSADFYTVCQNAGYEPEYVREIAADAIKRNCIWRAAPGTGEKARKNRHTGTTTRKHTQSR